MSWFTQPRTLEITGKALPQWAGEPLFVVSRLRGREKLGHLYEYDIEVSTIDAATLSANEAQALVDVDALIGKEITVNIAVEGNGTWVQGARGDAGMSNIGADIRKLTGLIVSAQCVGADDRRAFYRLKLRPWLWLATLNRDSRFWQERDVIEITRDVLQKYPFPFELRLAGPGMQRRPYPKRDYQRQWWESDFCYLNRIWQEWGISFFFERSTLVLCDSPGAYKKHGPADQTLRYLERDGQRIDEEHVHEFRVARQLTTGKASLTDYDYTQSLGNLAVAQEDYGGRAFDNAEEYAWGDYAQPMEGLMGTRGLRGDAQFEGEHLARVKVEAHRAKSLRAKGKGNLRGLMTGYTFTLEGYPLTPGDGEYLVVSTITDIVNNDTVTQRGAIDRQYSCTTKFAAVPANTFYRTPQKAMAVPANTFYRTPQKAKKPRAYAEAAVVTGYGDEPVYCDEYGRVKAHFIWDRLGEKDENASCWLRVASPWHGVEHGAMWLPRVGHHVLVGYYDSDPDRPYIISEHTTEFHQAPWQLPKNDALSGWRSRDLKGLAANSVVTDDTPGQLQVQVASDHAQSRLVLGYNTRIDGHSGRDKTRGEGFELATDAWGVMRANKGMLITTQTRAGACAAAKDNDEIVGRLEKAQVLHDALAQVAVQGEAQEAEGHQADIARTIQAQNEQLRGTAATDAAFPQLSEPHLLIDGKAGVEIASPATVHIAAQQAAVTAEGHVAIASGRSLFGTVRDTIRLFAQRAGIRLSAAAGDIVLHALTSSISLDCAKSITLLSKVIRITGVEKLELQGGKSRLVLDDSGAQIFTPGKFAAFAATHSLPGPKSTPADLSPKGVCIDCLLKAARGGSAFVIR